MNEDIRRIPVYNSEGKKYYVTEEEFWKLRDSIPQAGVIKIPKIGEEA